MKESLTRFTFAISDWYINTNILCSFLTDFNTHVPGFIGNSLKKILKISLFIFAWMQYCISQKHSLCVNINHWTMKHASRYYPIFFISLFCKLIIYYYLFHHQQLCSKYHHKLCRILKLSRMKCFSLSFIFHLAFCLQIQ